MLESLVVTLLPVVFLIIFFGGGALMQRQHIDVDGDPPIERRVFYASKYCMLAVWAAAVAQAWGLGLPLTARPDWLRWAAMAFWACGFALLFAGAVTMGDSVRMGLPQERTSLRLGGLFKVSRNPMYVGIFATLLAATLYTANPLVLIVAVFVAAVHHRIVLAEEVYLREAFAAEYAEYCRRVRRYL